MGQRISRVAGRRKKTWPARAAVGKLNVVLAEGKDARLVLDSTACDVNPMFLGQRVRLSTSSDVARTFSREDPYGRFVGLSLDFKAARKCVQVRKDEQGCLLFQRAGKLFHYTVCHFGAKFSAYWWQRVGGLLLRITRALLAKYSRKAWLGRPPRSASQAHLCRTDMPSCLLHGMPPRPHQLA